MKILILSRKRTLYSTRRFVETARAMGHEAMVVDPLNCFLACGGRDQSVYHKNSRKRLDNIDVVIPRIAATSAEYALAVVNHFEMLGVPVINTARGISQARDKLRSLQLLAQNDIDIPRTVMARTPAQIERALQEVGGPPVVLKLIQGSQGIGVMLAENQAALEAILNTLWGLGQNILIQEFVAESRGTDVRALVVRGKVVAGMKRVARAGEFRSNIHRGGTASVMRLPARFQRVATKAARVTGLMVAGVDMVESRTGPKVIEVNASPGFEGLESATGLDVARMILSFAVERADKDRHAGTGA